MCFYKDFDSIEYLVMLERFYEVGVNGKCWQLLMSWYEGAKCQITGCCLSHIQIKQGSILSPALFLLIVDPLLKALEWSGLGLSVNHFCAGGFLHADNIRTPATSTGSVEAQCQMTMVNDFAAHNFLGQNIQQCEIVMFSHG